MTAGAGACCGRCGVVAAVRPLSWSVQRGPDGAGELCDRCTREHLRSIEARLDESWWEHPGPGPELDR